MTLRANGRKLAILGYHKIGDPPPGGWSSWFYISESVFVSQLRHLRENGWQVISVAEFLRGLEAPESLPDRAALVTFDDGYRSNVQVAIPWLQRFGYPSVVFVPTQFIGAHNAFDDGYEPREAICDWDDLQELERRGCSIQSHSVSHKSLSGLNPAELERELLESKTVLETGLGKSVEVFAYPYGDEGVEQALTTDVLKQAGYRAACLYGGGPNPVPVADCYRLMRLAMGPDTDLRSLLIEEAEEVNR